MIREFRLGVQFGDAQTGQVEETSAATNVQNRKHRYGASAPGWETCGTLSFNELGVYSASPSGARDAFHG
jgi:hypothetical protein